jgi:hypothetical protein
MVLRKSNLPGRFFNSFPKPDFNVKGCFYDKEFIEQTEPQAPVITTPPDIESQIWCDPSMEYISFI